MHIGVPRERKTLEQRVALTPDGARELIKHGHTILIESGAGIGSSIPDQSYTDVGCRVVKSLTEVWKNSELVVKVKEPHEVEYELFRSDLILFDYLHLASLPSVAKALLDSKVTSFAYETVQTPDGRLPLLEPMSEVAGKLSVLNGSYFLLSQNGGRGVLLGGAVGVPPARVVVLGAGIAGRAACATAIGMGASVTVLDINHQKLEAIQSRFGSAVRTVHSTRASLERELTGADLLIGAVLVPGAATPKLLTREMIRLMGPKSVFVDISIDQGGCAETSKPTDLSQPTYEVDGVIHYGVCNMPAQTPRTSTYALTAATLPYIIKLADHGVAGCLEHSSEMRSALTTQNGKLLNKQTAEALGM
jgi:alanine dehydrogenase